MANSLHVDLVRQGGAALRQWQDANGHGHLDLRGADLRNVDLSDCQLGFSDFARADLSFANLQRSYIGHTNLRHARLVGTDLRDADLSGSDLTGADLSNADLRGTQLVGAVDLKNFRNVSDGPTPAKFFAANLKGTRFNERRTSSTEASFLELAAVEGLETAEFGDASFLPSYIQEAFEYAHDALAEERKFWPEFLEHVSERIQLIRTLFALPDRPTSLIVDLVQTISAELVSFLAKHPHALFELGPRRFEELIAEIIASFGWRVQLTPTTRDGGYDIFAVSRSISGKDVSWLIECKRYAPENRVGVDIVRALYGSRELLGLSGAQLMLATTSHFTAGVHAIKASRYDLELRDFEAIVEWINCYRPNRDGRLYVEDRRIVFPGDRSYDRSKRYD